MRLNSKKQRHITLVDCASLEIANALHFISYVDSCTHCPITFTITALYVTRKLARLVFRVGRDALPAMAVSKWRNLSRLPYTFRSLEVFVRLITQRRLDRMLTHVYRV